MKISYRVYGPCCVIPVKFGRMTRDSPLRNLFPGILWWNKQMVEVLLGSLDAHWKALPVSVQSGGSLFDVCRCDLLQVA